VKFSDLTTCTVQMQQYFPTNFQSFHTLHIKAALKQKNVLFAHGLLQTYSLVKQIVMEEKSLLSFWVYCNWCSKT